MLEDDEIAQVEILFNSFSQGKTGKLSIEFLPRILRLLNYNVGKEEVDDLIIYMSKSHVASSFSLKDLVELLSHFKFVHDKFSDLLKAFQELDQDGDGYIPEEEMVYFLTGMAETLNEAEVDYMLKLARDPQSENPELINIERIAKILVPSEDLVEYCEICLLRQKHQYDSQPYASVNQDETRAGDTRENYASNTIDDTRGGDTRDDSINYNSA